MSPIFSFTPDELALFRANKRDGIVDLLDEYSVDSIEIEKIELPDEKQVYEEVEKTKEKKPANMVVHPCSYHPDHTLANYVKYYLKTSRKIRPINRLDKNTSGIVVFAKNGEAESLLLDAFVKKYIQKKYYAWVFGNLYGNNLVHKGYLFKDSKKARVYIYDIKKPNTKETVTVINKVQGYNRTSLLEVEIPTGRTHQIRAVLSYLNMPIIGDEKYGNTTVNKSQKLKRQCLTAAKLSFAFPKENKLSYLNDMYFEIKPTWLDKIDKKL